MKINYNQLAVNYVRHRRIHPEVFRDLTLTGKLDRSSRILEVGCGTGNYVIEMEKTVNCSCWGLDPSDQMLAMARERGAAVHFSLGRAEQLDQPSEFFDLVYSVDVIHHVVDRQAYFHEAHRVLKKGGQICTVTDSEDIIRRRRPLSFYFPETVEIELKRYPKIKDLRSMMSEAGFVDLREISVEFSYDLKDIQPYRDKAYSSLHLISNEAFEEGIKRMEHDLIDGPIPSVSLYLLLWGTR